MHDLGPDDRFGEHPTPRQFASTWDGTQLTAAAAVPPGRIAVDAEQASASVVEHGACGAADTLTYTVPAQLVVDGEVLEGELFWDQRAMFSEVTLGVEGTGPEATLAWFSDLLATHTPDAGPVQAFASSWMLESREVRFGLYWDGPSGAGETNWQAIPELVQPFDVSR